jgi:hypothetical protein
MLGVRLGAGDWGGRSEVELALVCRSWCALRGVVLVEWLYEKGGRGEGRASNPRRSRKDVSLPVRSSVVC